MAESINGHVILNGPMYPRILKSQGGVMPDDDPITAIKSFAAWHLAKLAHNAIHEITSQVSLEGEVDTTIHLRKIADSVALIYGVSIEDMDKFMPMCRRQAFMLQMTWNPRFQAWLDSGGRKYNEVTREPGALSPE